MLQTKSIRGRAKKNDAEKEKSKENEQTLTDLRWLKTVSSTNISMGQCNHSLSLDATIMESKHCPIIGEHVVVLSIR